MRKPVDEIVSYHERTKHHPYRHARSAGFLDQESEPDPFRRYEGASLFRLPLLKKDPDGTYAGMFDRKGTPVHSLSLRNIACFLELSLGISAWKSYRGNSWALRMNPSSGNLHPTEAYLVLPPLQDDRLPGGVFHYNPLLHSLEMRATLDERFWSPIRRHFHTEGFLAGLSSIHWRESWKYGERAFRYSHLDMGHAVAAMGFSAALLGWKATYMNALSDSDVETLLGFTKTRWRKFEQEESGPLLFVHGAAVGEVPRGLPEQIIGALDSLSIAGDPNLLSAKHRDWHVIDEVAFHTRKPGTPEQTFHYAGSDYPEKKAVSFSAAEVIRRRRSALAYDGKTSLSQGQFFDILGRTLPENRSAPFDLELGGPAVHLLLFVHRVRGVEQGIYLFVRERKDFEEMREKCRPGFLWEKAHDTLPLYLLEQGDFRSKAAAASCDQQIAGNGAFCATMIARFRATIDQGPFRYRHLHWEAGMLGQVLYLAAEAHGMRGTGMGCFFDDVVHDLLGLLDDSYQDLYHFSVGKPVEDTRLATLPPYHHLKA